MFTVTRQSSRVYSPRQTVACNTHSNYSPIQILLYIYIFIFSCGSFQRGVVEYISGWKASYTAVLLSSSVWPPRWLRYIEQYNPFRGAMHIDQSEYTSIHCHDFCLKSLVLLLVCITAQDAFCFFIRPNSYSVTTNTLDRYYSINAIHNNSLV